VTIRAFILACAPLLLFGCALPETPAEKPEEAPKPAVKAPVADRNDEIPLRDPDVANELPDARLTGTGARTIGGGNDLSTSGTVVAHPPKTPAPSEPAPAEKKEE
jgi:hypothetical protein